MEAVVVGIRNLVAPNMVVALTAVTARPQDSDVVAKVELAVSRSLLKSTTTTAD